MVMKATCWNIRIAQVPIILHPDGRNRPPHLKPWKDGWRTLRFMLVYSPQWLFLIPGVVLSSLGFFGMFLLYGGPLHLNKVTFDSGSSVVAGIAVISGIQLIAFALSTKVFAINSGLMPEDRKLDAFFRYFTLEKGLVLPF